MPIWEVLTQWAIKEEEEEVGGREEVEETWSYEKNCREGIVGRTKLQPRTLLMRY